MNLNKNKQNGGFMIRLSIKQQSHSSQMLLHRISPNSQLRTPNIY